MVHRLHFNAFMPVQENVFPGFKDTTASHQTVSHTQRWIDHVTVAFVVVCSLWKFSLPLRSHGLFMGYAQDDFYYYLKAAQNLASGHGSTFDGITRTNGYHPLYFLLLTAVSFATHDLHAVFRCLWLLDVASSTAIFLAARVIFSRITPNPYLRNAFALCVLVPCIATISFQMETTLALPLGFAFLATAFVPPSGYTPARCALMGLLAALTMLARLDGAFLVLAFITGLLSTREGRRAFVPANVGAFAAAALPLLLFYFWTNLHFFHGLLPVSGAAKQLRHTWVPDRSQILVSFAGFTLVQFALAAVCLVLAALIWRYLRAEEKLSCVTCFLFPALFYTVEMLVSDWKLWGWYMYAVRFSTFASILVVAILLVRVLPARAPGLLRRAAELPWLAPASLAAGCMSLIVTHYRLENTMFSIESAAQQLSAFSQSHPGLYAMGDRAGMFGYLSPSPVLQSEGLMMDYAYLKHLRREDDLRSTLLGYGARYYAVYLGPEEVGQHEQNGCFQAAEPAIAGPDALRMRGEFCQPPVYAFHLGPGEYRVYQLQR